LTGRVPRSYVNFAEGCGTGFISTRPNRSTVTEGKGLVVTDDETVELDVGDVIHAPAGEQQQRAQHWHGAAPGETMTDLTIISDGVKMEQTEQYAQRSEGPARESDLV
jgi:quercetin dioxygenase-like cupin family protein